ncbi:uncharacterized protein Ccn [Drosophila virilis]|uniref:Uncharacterized protein, isoform B n=1 Tax=Drosophila virilis TaxID=7244 RepID=B4LEY3_DROVI|nr:uncharacterized protein LOC6623690 [Drosophila virilis]XP_015030858.1 uncharacterized protein LOC6623690 [Drosophila virilis]XP_032290187.1 uncharacterized protein LOC6623690 [Drosophila virilis]EDW69152.2 uncharacterized protein Dvir_GJ12283, isoform C [Drosophila virilis]KRF84209.1 uncharacterized protein Dvir_GJ12283, isoform B [Drosophila virilis]
MLILLPLLSIFGNSLIAGVGANLSLGFQVIRLPRHINPANCSVGNTTFVHGATFKLDCKTQCVCENGRHACSTLCPNEQLPAPEDTISCRSPRLVEVPGHCCKMWLCENPTADVYATCHNSSTSGNWTACSRACGLGMATRQTSTHAGCHQLSNLRLCENRRCAQDNKKTKSNSHSRLLTAERQQNLASSQLHQQHQQHHQQRERAGVRQRNGHGKGNGYGHGNGLDMQQEPAHRIRKGHECRSLQRLGPARIRLGECVSRKLYRPKLCGSCHRGTKCCIPAVSTTIQVELLCPLNAIDPINYVQKRIQQQHRQQDLAAEASSEGESWQPEGQLWDTIALEPIDQEFLQSHQIQIENKFVAIEWILKCECSKNYCSADMGESKNINIATNTTKHGYHNYNNNKNSNKKKHAQQQKQHYHETNGLQNELNPKHDALEDFAGYEAEEQQEERHVASDEAELVADNVNSKVSNEETSSSEQQPDIIPYPLSVGETSWKSEKLRRQQQQQQLQQERWIRT